MTPHRRTARATMELTVGEFVGLAAGLIRFVILARLLSPHNFGIAAALALLLQVLQTASNMALNTYLVQAADGRQASVQATLHALQLVRAVASGLALFLLAPLICSLFNIDEALSAFRWLALVPLIEGLAHLDVSGMERERIFVPGILALQLPRVVSAAVALFIVRWTGDYSSMVWLLAIQAAGTAVLSHVLARRAYRLAWDRGHVQKILGFGWPLLVNGFLLLGIFQGDRFIVGSFYSMEALGLYAAATAVALTLSNGLYKILFAQALPALAEVQQDAKAFTDRSAVTVRVFAAVSVVYGAVLMTGANSIVPLVFGDAYRAASVILLWLAASQSLRLLRMGPTVACMARGDTKAPMYANIVRLTGLVVALVAASQEASLEWIALAAVMGELLACPIPSLRYSRLVDGSTPSLLRPGVSAVACLAVAAFLGLRAPQVWAIVGGSALLAIGLGAIAWSLARKRPGAIADVNTMRSS